MCLLSRLTLRTLGFYQFLHIHLFIFFFEFFYSMTALILALSHSTSIEMNHYATVFSRLIIFNEFSRGLTARRKEPFFFLVDCTAHEIGFVWQRMRAWARWFACLTREEREQKKRDGKINKIRWRMSKVRKYEDSTKSHWWWWRETIDDKWIEEDVEKKRNCRWQSTTMKWRIYPSKKRKRKKWTTNNVITSPVRIQFMSSEFSFIFIPTQQLSFVVEWTRPDSAYLYWSANLCARLHACIMYPRRFPSTLFLNFLLKARENVHRCLCVNFTHSSLIFLRCFA